MKKTTIRTRIVATLAGIMLIAFALMTMTGCMPYYGTTNTQPTVEAVEGLPGTFDFQPLAIGTYADSITVNSKTAIAYVYYGGYSGAIVEENRIDIKVVAFDSEGNELPAEKVEWAFASSGNIEITAKELGTVKISAVKKTVNNADGVNDADEEAADGEDEEEIEEITGEYLEEYNSAEVTVKVSRKSFFFDILIIGFGLYIFITGVSGKGKLYKAEFLKEGKEKPYRLVTKICCIVVGLLMIGSGVIGICDAKNSLGTIKNIVFIAAIAAFIAGIAVTNGMIDKKAMQEATEKRNSGRDLKAPNAAFEFDDDEPTVDDVRKK